MKAEYIILGAGPTGLGALHRLKERGEDSVILLEKNSYPGGLASSFTDEKGFIWDIGGHVVFSHYEYYDRLLDSLLCDNFLEHQRESFVRAAATWVPYPFQNNIRHLPPEVRWDCVKALLPGMRSEKAPANFKEWILKIFGEGIARYFMLPYNFKVWATHPEDMDFSWIGERISIVDLRSVLKNILLERDQVSWGPNNTFKFPLKGGTGEIYRKLAARYEDNIIYNTKAVRIDTAQKIITDHLGNSFSYNNLLSTLPLDLLVTKLIPDSKTSLINAAAKLKHNSVFVGGIGLSESRPDSRCWMYFPERDCPFYRMTNFHNYSPNNTPVPGSGRALMCEVSHSNQKPEKLDSMLAEIEQGLVNTGLIGTAERNKIISRWSINVDYGYPVPCLERNEALKLLQPELEKLDIYSRGRFGGWKYEVSNMDHSVMQGVEWADRMVSGQPETTYRI
ncbi:protoporphyrinogen/coproporphyrinogen oxidase [Maridesulfovibrio bastinii]|uniref:protoporphyrinogen/coproporphyrinogen oxidase n=1 Tax=Maridesulfovibrio bastinii TaxID=47157 RepID=UPI000411C52E|nr:FAD-dependent oxidoreductase [Maridesulfovibrio bastinii]